MQKYTVFMIFGRLIMMVALYMLSTIFMGYPLSEVLLFYGAAAALASIGWWLNRQGEQLRDGR
jgi:hypothetical protein